MDGERKSNKFKLLASFDNDDNDDIFLFWIFLLTLLFCFSLTIVLKIVIYDNLWMILYIPSHNSILISQDSKKKKKKKKSIYFLAGLRTYQLSIEWILGHV